MDLTVNRKLVIDIKGIHSVYKCHTVTRSVANDRVIPPSRIFFQSTAFHPIFFYSNMDIPSGTSESTP